MGADKMRDEAEALESQSTRDYISKFASSTTEPVPPRTGPGAWLRNLLPRFDRLLSLDHSAARKASEEYDEAFHDAVHALKDLRQFAQIIAPTWQDASIRPSPASPAEPVPGDFKKLIEQVIRLAREDGASGYHDGHGFDISGLTRDARQSLISAYQKLEREKDGWKDIADSNRAAYESLLPSVQPKRVEFTPEFAQLEGNQEIGAGFEISDLFAELSRLREQVLTVEEKMMLRTDVLTALRGMICENPIVANWPTLKESWEKVLTDYETLLRRISKGETEK